MKIDPKYVTFEQAKLLKEKGFNELCLNAYNLNALQYVNGWCEYIDDCNLEIINSNLKSKDATAPEQWQVVEWLRVKHGIWVYVKPHALDNGVIKYSCRIYNLKLFIPFYIEGKAANFVSNSPQEAYSAAFDYILKELI